MNKARGLAPIVATLVVSLAIGCSTGVIHTVRTGENLYRIGKAYGVPYLQLGKVNGLDKPFTLQPGDRIFVPEAARVLPVGVITPRSVRSSPRFDTHDRVYLAAKAIGDAVDHGAKSGRVG